MRQTSKLQGDKRRTREQDEPFEVAWSPPLRLLVGAVGVGLMVNCLVKREVGPALLGTLGFGLFLRAVTNTGLGKMIGEAVSAHSAERVPERVAVEPGRRRKVEGSNGKRNDR